MYQIGQTVSFTPAAFVGENNPAHPKQSAIRGTVSGKIVHINWPHRYYTVEYTLRGVKLKESFKFKD